MRSQDYFGFQQGYLFCWFSGIASSGGNCTTADEPGIFEDVSLYSDWIKKTMEEAGYPYQF